MNAIQAVQTALGAGKTVNQEEVNKAFQYKPKLANIINRLRNQGYIIEKDNKGYSLVGIKQL